MPTNNTHILTGEWQIAPDPNNLGRDLGWQMRIQPQALAAPVPGVIQQALPGYHGVAWYWHAFDMAGVFGPELLTHQRVQLYFGAVDYLAEVWLNGHYAGCYEGGETPFEFDVTDALDLAGDNLLAVRVINPTDTAIDGFVLSEIPHRNKTSTVRSGSMLNTGGILYPVELRAVPVQRVCDVFARPIAHTGAIALTVTVCNSGAQPASGTLTLSVSIAADGSSALVEQTLALDIPVGTSTHEAVLHIAQPRLWDLDDPFLYRLSLALQAQDAPPHRRSLRVGFRELRIVDGYFHLNGKRIFLKSTHTGNHMPVGVAVPVNADFGRRDLIYAKASGFNMVRFIAGAAYPEQLDLCDELGLMVYEESLAAWTLADSPKMAERFDRNTGNMIRRDRNHACITIWGLLNETFNTPTFQHATAYLPTLRALDPTRLVLLSSGRWDGDPSIGSISNPGSGDWQHEWGVESAHPPAIDPTVPLDFTRFPPPAYVDRAGDAHMYPQMPLSQEAAQLVGRIGRETKPVFLSEFGIGSLQNIIGEWRNWEQTRAPELEEGAFLRRQVDMFQADWTRLGFDDVYPFPEDLLHESQRLHARQRAFTFDLIRANPRINGYNLTGMLDHALTGEGLWTFFRKWKPGTYDAVSEGWSPLRWCLWAHCTHVYAGQALRVEAHLANERALLPGNYSARLRALGPQGVVWDRTLAVAIPKGDVLAVPVLQEPIQIDGPTGEYTLAANLEHGGAPAGGRLKFYVTDARALPQLSGSIATWGVEASAERWLAGHGLICEPWPNATDERGSLVLVGAPSPAERTPARMAMLMAQLAAGATVIFLNRRVFEDGLDSTAYLPLKQRGRAYTAIDYLYHKECVARRHAVFEGLQAPGILDWDYYGPVVPHDVYEGLDTPDETMAASFAVGHHAYANGYCCGLLMGMYRHGAGKFILSTLPLLENLGAHPAADRLLLNLIRYAQSL